MSSQSGDFWFLRNFKFLLFTQASISVGDIRPVRLEGREHETHLSCREKGGGDACTLLYHFMPRHEEKVKGNHF